jgi:hypothetical protein
MKCIVANMVRIFKERNVPNKSIVNFLIQSGVELGDMSAVKGIDGDVYEDFAEKWKELD